MPESPRSRCVLAFAAPANIPRSARRSGRDPGRTARRRRPGPAATIVREGEETAIFVAKDGKAHGNRRIRLVGGTVESRSSRGSGPASRSSSTARTGLPRQRGDQPDTGEDAASRAHAGRRQDDGSRRRGAGAGQSRAIGLLALALVTVGDVVAHSAVPSGICPPLQFSAPSIVVTFARQDGAAATGNRHRSHRDAGRSSRSASFGGAGASAGVRSKSIRGATNLGAVRAPRPTWWWRCRQIPEPGRAGSTERAAGRRRAADRADGLRRSFRLFIHEPDRHASDHAPTSYDCEPMWSSSRRSSARSAPGLSRGQASGGARDPEVILTIPQKLVGGVADGRRTSPRR